MLARRAGAVLGSTRLVAARTQEDLDGVVAVLSGRRQRLAGRDSRLAQGATQAPGAGVCATQGLKAGCANVMVICIVATS